MDCAHPESPARWLITGSRGFVGRHLADFLLNQRSVAHVFGMDRPLAEQPASAESAVQRVNASLFDIPSIVSCLEEVQPTHAVHLAAHSSVAASWERPVEAFLNNTNIFLNLVEAIRLAGIPCRILSVGSSEEYGPRQLEEMPLRESLCPRPTNPYAVARVSQELLSRVYADAYGLDIICTRSFNHVGPDQAEQFVVSSLCKQAVEVLYGYREHVMVGDLNITRDFIDVRDVVRAYWMILSKGSQARLYNVCSGTGTQLRDLLTLISEVVGIDLNVVVDPGRLRPADNPVIVGDDSRLRALGFLPQIPLRTSVADQVDTWKRRLAGAIG